MSNSTQIYNNSLSSHLGTKSKNNLSQRKLSKCGEGCHIYNLFSILKHLITSISPLLMHFMRPIFVDMLLKCISLAPFNRKIIVKSIVVVPTIPFLVAFTGPPLWHNYLIATSTYTIFLNIVQPSFLDRTFPQ